MYEIDIRIHLEYVWHGTLHFSQILLSWFRLKQVSTARERVHVFFIFHFLSLSLECVKISAECAQCYKRC